MVIKILSRKIIGYGYHIKGVALAWNRL